MARCRRAERVAFWSGHAAKSCRVGRRFWRSAKDRRLLAQSGGCPKWIDVHLWRGRPKGIISWRRHGPFGGALAINVVKDGWSETTEKISIRVNDGEKRGGWWIRLPETPTSSGAEGNWRLLGYARAQGLPVVLILDCGTRWCYCCCCCKAVQKSERLAWIVSRSKLLAEEC